LKRKEPNDTLPLFKKWLKEDFKEESETEEGRRRLAAFVVLVKGVWDGKKRADR